MAGRGRPPKPPGQRRGRNKLTRGDWQAAEAIGWQHGDVPAAPDGLRAETLRAWQTWMASWFAAHWTPEDLPGLETTILLYDQVRRGEFTRTTELRQYMDNYGITPKGQQDRHWQRPKPEEASSPQPQRRRESAYAHLRVVNE